MIGALWTGISGLASHQKSIDNESHNIANVNTIGYKASRISFADQMYQDKIGKGSKILDAEKLYTQGNLKVTGVNFDMALSGQGFFTVSDTRSSGTSETYFTRAGNFRMGEDGTLQDAAGNKVQGWAMSPIDQNVDVISSNPNISIFTNEYNKLLSSQIIKHSTYVETFTAKSTDYTQTAKADNQTVFTGYGLKTKSAKISDVEALIKDYTNWLQKLKENPDGASATSMAQVSTIDLPDVGTNGAISKEGDQVYVYINGNKISQSWDTDYNTTMQKFADKISAIPGFKAYTAQAGTYNATTEAGTKQVDTFSSTTALGTNVTLNIASALGAKSVTIPSTGTLAGDSNALMIAINSDMTLANQVVANIDPVTNDLVITSKNPGASFTLTQTVGTGNLTTTPGSAIGIPQGILRIESMIPGQQFTVSETGMITDGIITQGVTDIRVPPITGAGLGALQSSMLALEKAIVGKQQDVYTPQELGELDGAVFTYEIKIYDKDAQKNIDIPDTASPRVPLTINLPAAGATIDDIVDAINKDSGGSGDLQDYVKAYNINGNLVIKTLESNFDVKFSGTFEKTTSTAVPSDIGYKEKSPEYSGRDGAGAEFIQIVNTIDQAASKGSLQLRLDTLNISDSAFGEFNVDSTGLITMKQDGAEFAIGQVAIAVFSNERGLIPVGDNLVAKSSESGEPVFNINNDKTAKIEGKTLELSTADLSESLVNLMVFQRAFEANAKSITTSDELLNTLINLKR